MPGLVVARIVDVHGRGQGVVVATMPELRAMLRPGQNFFLLPGVQLDRHLELHEAKPIIDAAIAYADARLKGGNKCGECSACCTTPYINEDGLHKPSHRNCKHLNRQKTGCSIHDRRPFPCRGFECVWLQSQYTDAPLSGDMRPDKCGVMLTLDTAPSIGRPFDPDLLEVHVEKDRPDAHTREPVASFLKDKKWKLITFYYSEK